MGENIFTVMLVAMMVNQLKTRFSCIQMFVSYHLMIMMMIKLVAMFIELWQIKQRQGSDARIISFDCPNCIAAIKVSSLGADWQRKGEKQKKPKN